MRTTNWQLLRNWVENNGDGSKIDLHMKSKVSLTWIEKVISNRYRSAPRPLTRMAVCMATGLSEEKLFPFVPAIGKAKAS